MLKMTVDEIVKEIPKLSKRDLRKLKIQIDFFLKGAGIGTKETGNTASYLEDVILFYAKKYVQVPSKDALWATDPQQQGTKLIVSSTELEKLAAKYKLDRTLTIKLVRIAIQCSIEKLNEINVPLSFRTMLDRLVDPSSLLDECYPDYMKSKIFRNLILNQKE